MQFSVYLILVILDQGQVTKHFCGISFVMYLVFCNYSNAGPECQAKRNGCNKIDFLLRAAVSPLPHRQQPGSARCIARLIEVGFLFFFFFKKIKKTVHSDEARGRNAVEKLSTSCQIFNEYQAKY